MHGSRVRPGATPTCPRHQRWRPANPRSRANPLKDKANLGRQARPGPGVCRRLEGRHRGSPCWQDRPLGECGGPWRRGVNPIDVFWVYWVINVGGDAGLFRCVSACLRDHQQQRSAKKLKIHAGDFFGQFARLHLTHRTPAPPSMLGLSSRRHYVSAPEKDQLTYYDIFDVLDRVRQGILEVSYYSVQSSISPALTSC